MKKPLIQTVYPPTLSLSWLNPALVFFISLLDGAAASMVFTTLIPLVIQPKYHFFASALPHQTRIIFLGILLAMMPVGQLIGAPFWGRLADRRGRKKILIVTLAGSILGFMMTAIAIHSFFIGLLIAARLLTGFTASNIAIGQASLADTHKNKTRTGSFNIQQIAIGIGLGAGPAFATFFSGGGHFSRPFYLIAIIYIILTLFVCVGFKETYRPGNTASTQTHGFFSVFRTIHQMLKNKPARNALITFTLFMLGWNLYFQFSTVFWMKQYHLNNHQLSHVFIFISCMALFAQLFLVQPLSRILPPARVIPWALFGVAATFIILAFVPFHWSFYLTLSLYCLCIAFLITHLVTHVSLSASAIQQGTILGMLVSMSALASLSITSIGGFIVAYFPLAPFVLSSAIILSSLAFWLFAQHKVKT